MKADGYREIYSRKNGFVFLRFKVRGDINKILKGDN